jgi:hypothetical protein
MRRNAVLSAQVVIIKVIWQRLLCALCMQQLGILVFSFTSGVKAGAVATVTKA